VPTVSDQGIVLRAWELSETSQTVSSLLREHGLIRGLAKGARRERSPYSGGFEPTAMGDVTAIIKDNTDLANITEFALRRMCFAARRSLAAHHAAMYLVDLAHHALSPGDPHPRAFDALEAALCSLDEPHAAIARFAWRLLDESGIAPELLRDAHGGGPLAEEGPLGFDPELSGLTADPGPAGSRPEGPWRVSRATVRAVRAVAAGEDVSGEPAGRVARLLTAHWNYVLSRHLPTRDAAVEISERQPSGLLTKRVDAVDRASDDQTTVAGASPCPS